MCHVGKRADLGKNVEVGFNAYVEDGARIGHNVRIGAFAEALSGSVVGANCVIGSMHALILFIRALSSLS